MDHVPNILQIHPPSSPGFVLGLADCQNEKPKSQHGELYAQRRKMSPASPHPPPTGGAEGLHSRAARCSPCTHF